MSVPRRSLRDFLFEPQPLVRLEIIRALVPLAVLGFLSSRIVHADEWFSTAGFHVPDIGFDDWRQPLYLAPVSPATAWGLCVVLVVSGLFLSAGAWTRISAFVFAITLTYVALADRLATFTVTKLGCVLAFSLWLTPCGARWSVDAWRSRRNKDRDVAAHEPQSTDVRPTLVTGGAVRYFQILLVVFYCASGIAKARGDWLSHSAVIWTHLHDSYQTAFAYFLATIMPAWAWSLLQYLTLAFEALAPLWFWMKRTRTLAVIWGVAMHTMIGLMFGPLGWFSLLMIVLLVAGFGPLSWLERLEQL